LRLKFRLGLFERPYVDADAAPIHFETGEQRALARTAAAEAMVLLKNDGVLPIAPGVRRIALIGPGADDPRLLQGDYHYPTHQEIIFLNPARETDPNTAPVAGGDYAPGAYYTPHITPLAALRQALGDRTEVRYEPGCSVLGDDRSGFDAAVRAARESDIAVVIVAGKSGLQPPVTVGEGIDATDLRLTGVQEELVQAVAGAGKPLVVVVLSGRVHTLAGVAGCANALLWTAPSGEEGGAALAAILTGAGNPSGRLPVSLPRAVGQVPVHSGKRAASYRAVLREGYVDSPASPLYPFGHGLSYTAFGYAALQVQATTTTELLQVSLEVHNSGARAGDEVVQLYVTDEAASVARPDRQLIGFARVALEPGQAKRLTFAIHPSRLAFYDAEMHFVVEPGAFTFQAGASADDIRFAQTVMLGGDVASYQQRSIVATRVAVEEGSGFPTRV
jgi:beta-glucosidase